MKKTLSIATIALVFMLFTSCEDKKPAETTKSEAKTEEKKAITISEQEVLAIQKTWGEGIVHIGKVFLEKGDYKAAAEKRIEELYGYSLGPVLRKPTSASEKQFRLDKEGALSYFVGHNDKYTEDGGFAIKPWSAVRWESKGIKTEGNMAIAMGNYYFTPAKGGDDVKVEYAFAYTKDNDGKLRIILHGSHLPYSPAK